MMVTNVYSERSNRYNLLLTSVQNQLSRALKMSIDPKLLHILRCPVSKQKLNTVSEDDLVILNQCISEEALQHIDGSIVKEHLSAALTTENRHTIYKIVNGIAVMLENESIPAEQVDNW